MARFVKNPNDIVNDYVADYAAALGGSLVSVIMYGSAVTHEYVPGKSDINTAVILTDTSVPMLMKTAPVQKKWFRYGVVPPFFMTEQYIASSLDTFPVEFLDMQLSHRVLSGKDVLAGIEIGREHLRLQCERELKSVAIHLRRHFVAAVGNDERLYELIGLSFKRLLPLFKALLMLNGRKVPYVKSDIIVSTESLFGLGASVFSRILNMRSRRDVPRESSALFDHYLKAIDTITAATDAGIKKEVSA